MKIRIRGVLVRTVHVATFPILFRMALPALLIWFCVLASWFYVQPNSLGPTATIALTAAKESDFCLLGRLRYAAGHLLALKVTLERASGFSSHQYPLPSVGKVTFARVMLRNLGIAFYLELYFASPCVR